MAGKRKGTVKESLDQLKALAPWYRSGKEKRLIDMLLLILEDPTRTAECLATALECNEKTIRLTWSRYNEVGLDAMLGIQEGKVPSHPPEQARRVATTTTSAGFDAGLVQFLNDLPVCTVTLKWIESFKQGLQKLFPEIDRVTVNVNIYYDLQDPDYLPSSFMVVEHKKDGKTTVSTRERHKQPGEHLLEEARKLKFPFHRYHPPHVFDFQMPGGQATIGTIILWRENWRPGISEGTLSAFAELRPFMAFLLSDCVARRQKDSRDMRFFNEVINQVASKDGLTRREQEALVHHLFGSNHQKIATEMGIAVNTVRKHVKSIRDKTGTHSVAELFARYLSPLSQL